MKKLFFVAVTSILLMGFASRAEASLAQLTVTISNIDAEKGEIRVLLYDAADFLTRDPRFTQGEPAVPGTMTVTFQDVPAGEWAILAYHDANMNHDLDRNILGIPTEQFGFSNNPGYNHKPSFAETRFAIADQDGALDIKLSDE